MIKDMQPMDIYQKYKDKRKWMLDNNIFSIKEVGNEKKIVIPSFECNITKNDKISKKHFPFYHQVFWFIMEDLNDLKFAISEFETFVKPNGRYTFPNGTVIEIII